MRKPRLQNQDDNTRGRPAAAAGPAAAASAPAAGATAGRHGGSRTAGATPTADGADGLRRGRTPAGAGGAASDPGDRLGARRGLGGASGDGSRSPLPAAALRADVRPAADADSAGRTARRGGRDTGGGRHAAHGRAERAGHARGGRLATSVDIDRPRRSDGRAERPGRDRLRGPDRAALGDHRGPGTRIDRNTDRRPGRLDAAAGLRGLPPARPRSAARAPLPGVAGIARHGGRPLAAGVPLRAPPPAVPNLPPAQQAQFTRGLNDRLARWQARPPQPLIARPSPLQKGPVTGAPPRGETRFRSKEVVFQVNSNVPPGEVDRLARRQGLVPVATTKLTLLGTTVYRYRAAKGQAVPAVVQGLEGDRRIAAAQPNYRFELQGDTGPAPAAAVNQYTVAKLELTEAHRISEGDKTVVAVIDSGVDADHPELADASVQLVNALDSDFQAHPHGTAIAGIIAAHGQLTGVAPDARILAVRAFSTVAGKAEGTTETILQGIEWAIEHGAQVVNLSFAGPRDPILSAALEVAAQNGIIFVAAVGNAGPNSPPLYPAADPSVISVTATDSDDHIFSHANRGDYISVAAPGVDIVAPVPNDGYQILSGTSFAAAHVTGLIALLLDRDPTLKPAEIRTILTDTARRLGPQDDYGSGLIDSLAALRKAQAEVAASTDHAPAHPPAASGELQAVLPAR
jgi:subtilisin family serine protease